MPIAAALPMIFMGVSAAGALMSASNQIQAGKAQQQAADYNAQVAEADALALKNKFGYEETLSRERAQKVLGAQRAAYGASGVAIDEGTPLDVMRSQVYESERDALNIRYQGAAEVAKRLNEAKLARYGGDVAVSTSRSNAASTIIQSAGRIGSAYYGGKLNRGNIPSTTTIYNPYAYEAGPY